MHEIAALKRKHRFIFCTQLAGINILWRPLTLKEHDIYLKILQMNLTSVGAVYSQIFKDIVLSPEVIDAMDISPPGLVDSIVNAALHISGLPMYSEDWMNIFNNQIAEMRETVQNNVMENFIRFICHAFPSYTPSDIEDLEYQELLRLLVMAEQILKPEVPIYLERPKKEKSLPDKLFADKHKAEQFERLPVPKPGQPSVPSEGHLHDQPPTPKQAKQIEMIRRLRERRAG
jgi:hypothetical protein